MVEHRVTEVESPAGATQIHTTVIDDGRSGSGGGSGWMIALILVIALAAGIYYFSGMSRSQSAKDTAIAGAAENVGDAAKQVGNAAEDAAKKMGNQ